MAFSDQKFITRVLVPAGFNVTSTATITASGHVVTNTAAYRLPKFLRRTKISAIRAKVVTAPNAGATSTRMVFLNGTSTFAVVTVSTNTAGVSVDATMTDANATFAADVEPTVNVLSTGTASSAAVTQGNYDLYFEQAEQYS
jgi:hypothetical protein